MPGRQKPPRAPRGPLCTGEGHDVVPCPVADQHRLVIERDLLPELQSESVAHAGETEPHKSGHAKALRDVPQSMRRSGTWPERTSSGIRSRKLLASSSPLPLDRLLPLPLTDPARTALPDRPAEGMRAASSLNRTKGEIRIF